MAEVLQGKETGIEDVIVTDIGTGLQFSFVNYSCSFLVLGKKL